MVAHLHCLQHWPDTEIKHWMQQQRDIPVHGQQEAVPQQAVKQLFCTHTQQRCWASQKPKHRPFLVLLQVLKVAATNSQKYAFDVLQHNMQMPAEILLGKALAWGQLWSCDAYL